MLIYFLLSLLLFAQRNKGERSRTILAYSNKTLINYKNGT